MMGSKKKKGKVLINPCYVVVQPTTEWRVTLHNCEHESSVKSQKLGLLIRLPHNIYNKLIRRPDY